MRQHRRTMSVVFSLLFFLSAMALLVVELGLAEQVGEIVWLILLITCCCLPGLVTWIRGTFDVFEPVHSITIPTFIYFGLIVSLLMWADSFRMLGIDYRDEIANVVFLALLALLSFYVTYYGAYHQAVRPSVQQGLTRGDLAYAHRLSWLLFGLFALLAVLWIVLGRIPLWSLWVFGQGSYEGWKSAASGITLGYLYGAQEALPGCVLLLIATRTKRCWTIVPVLLLAAITIFFVGLGVRARVFLTAGGAIAFYFLEKQRRPSIWQILAMAFVVFYAVVGAVGYLRTPDNPARRHIVVTVSEAWTHFIASSDIATTTAVYLHWVPVRGHDWGKQFLDLFLTPIPSYFWPDKYDYFGTSSIGEFLAIGSAAPIYVAFFVSFGSVGVVLCMAIIGWLCRRVYDSYRANPRNPFLQVSLALLWAYLFHIYGRHSLTLIVFGVIYVFASVWIVYWLVNSRHRKAISYVCDGAIIES